MTTPTEPIAIATKVTGTFDDVVTRTRGALAEQGFGILTEIDMQATLKRSWTRTGKVPDPGCL